MTTQELSSWIRERYAEAGRLPEFVHLTRVGGMAQSNADRAVAWLHDIVEDDISTLDEIRTALERTTEFNNEDIDEIVVSVDTLMRRTSAGKRTRPTSSGSSTPATNAHFG